MRRDYRAGSLRSDLTDFAGGAGRLERAGLSEVRDPESAFGDPFRYGVNGGIWRLDDVLGRVAQWYFSQRGRPLGCPGSRSSFAGFEGCFARDGVVGGCHRDCAKPLGTRELDPDLDEFAETGAERVCTHDVHEGVDVGDLNQEAVLVGLDAALPVNRSNIGARRWFSRVAVIAAAGAESEQQRRRDDYGNQPA